MKQRAVKAGVLSNPYQYVEPGQEFDRPERMNWAVPIEEPPAAIEAVPIEEPAEAAPVSAEPEAPAKPTRKRAKAEPVADDSAEDVI